MQDDSLSLGHSGAPFSSVLQKLFSREGAGTERKRQKLFKCRDAILDCRFHSSSPCVTSIRTGRRPVPTVKAGDGANKQAAFSGERTGSLHASGSGDVAGQLVSRRRPLRLGRVHGRTEALGAHRVQRVLGVFERQYGVPDRSPDLVVGARLYVSHTHHVSAPRRPSSLPALMRQAVAGVIANHTQNIAEPRP